MYEPDVIFFRFVKVSARGNFDYIFYNNAGVLQTSKDVYGIIINEKALELNEKLSLIKKDEFDFVPVILKGKLSSKNENEEGWSVKLEITEIVEIVNKQK
jgi:hypothetical protein